MAKNRDQTRKKKKKQSHLIQMTPINTLPDDALLEIFDFYMKFSQHDKISTVYFCGTSNVSKEEIEAWQTLVHVCRLWRNIVFGSPRRLNLRLVCTPETPLSNVQDIWPALPLCIHDCMEYPTKSAYDIIAAFGHDRICQLLIRRCKWWELGELWAAMQVPFPELTVLDINPFDPFQGTPVIPDSFLGGSAPRLRSLYLFRIPFPGLPKLLSSATHLVTLRLCEIPISGYISPESMANCLSVLTSLHDLIILFKPDQYLPDRETRRLSPPIRSVLPALTEFDFGGNNEYLEDLIARIDLPRLKNLRIVFPEQTHYEISQLLQLISRTPSFDRPEKAILDFNFYNFGITLLSQRPGTGVLTVKILNVRPYRFTDQEVLALARVCTSALPLLSAVENLFFCEPELFEAKWEDNIEGAPWLELLRLFTTVKNLYLSEKCEPRVVLALQKLVEESRTMEVLPTLESLFLWGSGPVHEGVERFVTARQLTSPIVVLRWDGLFEQGQYNLW